MIDEIRVRDVALIKEACMAPSKRLTVLTGETGAGKTALLSACKLLMGARADKGVVREGAESATVQGRLFGRFAGLDGASPASEGGDAPSEVQCASAGSETQECEVVVSRKLTADGRSRVSVNGDMVSVSQLSRIVAPTIDLCGQHEHQALMKPANHAAMLDAWAAQGVAHALAEYEAAFVRAREALREFERACEAGEASQAQLEEARFALRQIDAVGPAEGEYEDLVSSLGRTEHAEALARAADVAHEALSGEGGALDALNAAAAALAEAARFDESLGGYAESLREAGYVVEDVARDALAYRDGVEFDPHQLLAAQERVGALQGLMRTYGPRMEDVLAKRDEAYELVSMVDEADERERAAKRRLDEAEAQLAAAAERLHEARAQAAPQFALQVTAVMSRLEMGSAELECRVEMLPRASWTKAGPSAVELFFRPGAGMQARPLARIASGGEVSRVMLAVKVVLGGNDSVSTLVFDEVDAGVGGATAVALAQVLADLAQTHQVIVVTHLAQVAVAADAHYVVRKLAGDVPETVLEEVRGEAREVEVARMLSGDASEASLAHAREMLSR